MRLIVTFLIATVIAVGQTAQKSPAADTARTESPGKRLKYNGSGHVYFATGVCQHTHPHLGVGGGAEAFLWRGLALGGSAGYHQFVDDVGFGLASLDLGYHFTSRKTPKRIDPFVTVSPVGAFFTGNGFGAAFGIGGGVNYWFKEKIAIRTEVRLQALADDEALVVFRVGLNFR